MNFAQPTCNLAQHIFNTNQLLFSQLTELYLNTLNLQCIEFTFTNPLWATKQPKSPTEMRFSGAFSFTYFIAKHITKFGFVYV